jgi:hypothetical protein
MNEALYIKNAFGAVYQGRQWLDGTGNFGQEGNETPLGNLVAALQAVPRSSGGGGGYRWRDDIIAAVAVRRTSAFGSIHRGAVTPAAAASPVGAPGPIQAPLAQVVGWRGDLRLRGGRRRVKRRGTPRVLITSSLELASPVRVSL